MNITETATASPSRARWRIPSIHLPEQARTAVFFATSAAIGGAGWSGDPALNYLALLFPFVYLHTLALILWQHKSCTYLYCTLGR